MNYSVYLPDDLAAEVKKYKISMSAAAQAGVREAVALQKALNPPAEEVPSLKKLLNISHDEGKMSFLVSTEVPFTDVSTVAEGVQQALTALRRVFGPEALFQTSLVPCSMHITNGTVTGKLKAKVYTL